VLVGFFGVVDVMGFVVTLDPASVPFVSKGFSSFAMFSVGSPLIVSVFFPSAKVFPLVSL